MFSIVFLESVNSYYFGNENFLVFVKFGFEPKSTENKIIFDYSLVEQFDTLNMKHVFLSFRCPVALMLLMLLLHVKDSIHCSINGCLTKSHLVISFLFLNMKHLPSFHKISLFLFLFFIIFFVIIMQKKQIVKNDWEMR